VTAEFEPGVTFDSTTSDAQIPGPTIRDDQVDTVELTLENPASNSMAHDVDLHAVDLHAVDGSSTGPTPPRVGWTAGLFSPPLFPAAVLAVELHAHSQCSYDGRDPVEKLLQQAAAVGLDGLAVTDHDELDASLAAADLAPEYGLVGIPGMEVSTDAGHVLAIGVEALIPAGLAFGATIDRIHDHGGIAIVPHPFQEFRSGVLANIDEGQLTAADAIEAFNSRLLTGRANRQAERFAERHGKPMTAGSDAHIFEMVGQAITLVETDDRSVDAIVDAVREGRTTVEGHRTPWRVSLRQAAGGVKRRMHSRVRSYLE